VLWSVDTYDWKRDADAIVRIVSRDTRNGSIILMHDSKGGTVRVLPAVIQELQSRGLKLVTVSELTGLPAYDFGVPVVKTDSPEPES
jgi:peptidoglycan/xylan/chitin deacetylase (PgdA/CDA1 family)